MADHVAKVEKFAPRVSGEGWRSPPTNPWGWRLELVEEAAREARAGILAAARDHRSAGSFPAHETPKRVTDAEGELTRLRRSRSVVREYGAVVMAVAV